MRPDELIELPQGFSTRVYFEQDDCSGAPWEESGANRGA